MNAKPPIHRSACLFLLLMLCAILTTWVSTPVLVSAQTSDGVELELEELDAADTFDFELDDNAPDPFDLSSSASKVKVTYQWNYTKAHPGDQRLLAVILDIEKPWHLYADKLQFQHDSFTSTEVVPDAQSGYNNSIVNVLTFESALYPTGKDFEAEAIGLTGKARMFEGRTVILVPVKVDADAKPGQYQFLLNLSFQACTDTTCLKPVGHPISDPLPIYVDMEIVDRDTAVGEVTDGELFTDYVIRLNTVDFGSFGIDASHFWGMTLFLLVAAAGGLLLNFTPCVLPVIPIKIMGLSQSAGNPARCFLLGAVMSAGVITFWLGIGTAIAVSTTFFTKTGGFTETNQLFQNPGFPIAVGIFIAAMAIGMCGLFSVGLPNWVYRIQPKHDSLPGSFAFGIMTAVLSTPCTAPFMGTAAAWAVSRSWSITLLTFAAIGGGMALPYLILSADPRLVKKMPRTGPASELIKQVMGLFMLAAAAYFIGTGIAASLVKPPAPPTQLYWWAVMAFVIAGGAWLAWRTVRITPAPVKRGIFCTLGILLIAGGTYAGIRLTAKPPVNWVYYTPETFAEAQQRGDVIVVDFTAEWCINCKSLEYGVLYTEDVYKLLNSKGITPIKVDITGPNPDGKAKLHEAKRLTIPLLVIYTPDGQEVWKNDFYTPSQLIAAIRQAQQMAGHQQAPQPVADISPNKRK